MSRRGAGVQEMHPAPALLLVLVGMAELCGCWHLVHLLSSGTGCCSAECLG